MKKSIRQRLFVTFLVIIVICAAQGAAGVLNLVRLSQERQVGARGTEQLHQTQLAMGMLRLKLFQYLGTTNPEEMQALQKQVLALQKTTAAQTQGLGIPPALLAAYQKTNAQVLKLHYDFETTKAQGLMYAQGRKQHEAIMDRLQKRLGDYSADMQKKDNDSLTWGVALTLGLLALGAGVAVAAWIAVKRTVILPLQHTNRILRDLAEGRGDLTVRMELRQQDEMGEMVSAFNRVIANLREMFVQVRQTAVELMETSSSVTFSAQEGARLTSNVAAHVEKLYQGSTTQAQAVDRAKNAVSQSSAAISAVVFSCQTVADATGQATVAVEQGNASVGVAVEKIEQVQHHCGKTEDMVVQLGQHTLHITQMVEVISSIAEQTNLLALNAAIEAARAGEHGRGFAVVAEEVRKLAEESGKAAHQISGLIREVQGESRSVSQEMQSQTQQVTDGADTVRQAGDAFGEIRRVVGEIVEKIGAINDASSVMERENHTVVSAITEVSDITGQATSMAGEVMAFAQEQAAASQTILDITGGLMDKARQLGDLVVQFRV